MFQSARLGCLILMVVGLLGCGGNDGPPDSQFEMKPPDIQLANDVRGSVEGLEPSANLAQVGSLLVENLEGMIESPGAEAHKETYQKILEAAKQMAAGDKSKLAEIKKLAETLPK